MEANTSKSKICFQLPCITGAYLLVKFKLCHHFLTKRQHYLKVYLRSEYMISTDYNEEKKFSKIISFVEDS